MSSGAAASFRSVLEALEKYGLLLESDAQLPSLVSIVAGGPVRGSWWGHASGNIIYEVGNRLANHPDVLVIKLVSGKVTFVQRRQNSSKRGNTGPGALALLSHRNLQRKERWRWRTHCWC